MRARLRDGAVALVGLRVSCGCAFGGVGVLVELHVPSGMHECYV